MHASRRIPAALATAAAIALLASCAAPSTAADGAVHDYRAAQGEVPNPERGFYHRLDTVVTERDFSEAKRDGITLLHSYVQLDDFRDGPISDAFLAKLGEGLDAVRASGMTIIIRFAYNSGTGSDAPRSRIEEHLAQLKPLLAAHADVIAGVEAGFLGQWGEWHDSTNGLDSASQKKALLKEILSAVPTDRDVIVRYPADIRSYLGTPPKVTATTSDPVTRIGNHQDCFLSRSPDDTGTWGRDHTSPAEDKRFIAAVGRYAMVGGETCNSDPPARTNCTTALRELAQMHFTYLNSDFEKNSLDKLRAEGCYDEIAQRLGYRISAISATFPDRLDAAATSFRWSIDLRNTGFASPVNARPVYLVLRDGATSTAIALDADPRAWDPGRTRLSGTATLPHALDPGKYTLALWIPDGDDALRKDASYSIRLASTGMWDAAHGDNVLGTVTVAR